MVKKVKKDKTEEKDYFIMVDGSTLNEIGPYTKKEAEKDIENCLVDGMDPKDILVVKGKIVPFEVGKPIIKE